MPIMAQSCSVETLQSPRNLRIEFVREVESASAASAPPKSDDSDTFESREKSLSPKPEDFRSIQSKDLSRRKRTSRTAKLKQCKLDARREQWLSHAASSLNAIRSSPVSVASSMQSSKSSLSTEDENSLLALNHVQTEFANGSSHPHLSSSVHSKPNHVDQRSGEALEIRGEHSEANLELMDEKERESDAFCFKKNVPDTVEEKAGIEGENHAAAAADATCTYEYSLIYASSEVEFLEKESRNHTDLANHGIAKGTISIPTDSCNDDADCNSSKTDPKKGKKKKKQVIKRDGSLEANKQGEKVETAQEVTDVTPNSSPVSTSENEGKDCSMDVLDFNANSSSGATVKKKKSKSETKNIDTTKLEGVQPSNPKPVTLSTSSPSSSLSSSSSSSPAFSVLEDNPPSYHPRSASSGGTVEGGRENQKEEEEERAGNGWRSEEGFDDWETAADMVYLKDDEQSHPPRATEQDGDDSKKNSSITLSEPQHSDVPKFGRSASYQEGSPSSHHHGQSSFPRSSSLRPDYKYHSGWNGLRPTPRSSSMGGGDRPTRAWRPDDAFRPHSLPPLAHPKSSADGLGSVFGRRQDWEYSIFGSSPSSAPSVCPICAEELDVTDSSFIPCSCGFRLCLFCHHRIALEDGRCPGCRKTYNNNPQPTANALSRTPNLWLRV